jgi:hypothetical protein
MMVAMAVVLFFILGMFLSMLGSSPRSEAEWQADTEPAGDELSATSATLPSV